MNTNTYKVKSYKNFTRFEFQSSGRKGTVVKLIEFQKTTSPVVYNLAFGDYDRSTGRIDDLIVTDNQDTDKVLATVAKAVYVFFENNPNVFVYATGSTESRTRLYRIRLTRHYKELTKD